MDSGGYGVDLLRSCYRTDMVFTAGGPAIPIRWYFCDKTAKVLPYATTFNSRNWSKQLTPWPEIGEVEGSPRVWVDGSIPKDEPTGIIVGTEDEWQEGQATIEDGIPVNPDCEYINQPPDAGGLELGGDTTTTTAKWNTVCCSGVFQRQLTMWFRPFADLNEALPAWAPMTYVSFLNLMGTSWQFDGHTYALFVFCSAGPHVYTLNYIVDGTTQVVATAVNVNVCTVQRMLFSPLQLKPAVPDPFKFYLYDVWVTQPGAPRPF